ncbi:MAG TPA: hypothetical protein VFN10_03870 [Thermoanaerobaculia bacterium]|nr:hypothetical protein [Thermoanaerobaculia bacterium]
MTTRSRLLLLIVALFALPLLAQPANPRFFIDSIAVTGLRYVSERVIVSETRLQPGREYSEAELHAGAARAARLPFVVRVDMRLERGGERGAYRLILEVTEKKPLFYGATYNSGSETTPDLHNLTAGARAFFGRSDTVYGAITAGDAEPRFELGYTHYDLFGRGVVLSAVAQTRPFVTTIPEELYEASSADELVTRVVAAVPLRGNHALRATWSTWPTLLRSTTPIEQLDRKHTYEPVRGDTYELAWLYDSTDDPLFPTSGSRTTVGAVMQNRPFTAHIQGPLRPLARGTSHDPWLYADVWHYWSLTPRQSISARGEDLIARRGLGFSDQHETFNQLFGATAWSFDVWDPQRSSRPGDLRLELGVEALQSHIKVNDPLVPAENYLDTGAHIAVVFRNEWGVIRVRFDFENTEER